MKITCKLCKYSGEHTDVAFTNCQTQGCKLKQARNPPKPMLIEGPVVNRKHSPDCTCRRCLEEDTANLEKVFDAFKAKVTTTLTVVPKPVQMPIRVLYREEEVGSTYDENQECVFVNVPLVICLNIYPKGKKK